MKKTSIINRDFKALSIGKVARSRSSLLFVLLGTLGLFITVLYFKGNVSNPSDREATSREIPIDLPDASSKVQSTQLSVNTAPALPKPTSPPSPSPQKWTPYTVKSGDNLAKIFKHFSLSASTLHHIINSSEQAKALTKIKPGQVIKFSKNANDGFLALEYALDPVRSLRIQSILSGYESTLIEKPVKIVHNTASAVINNSLFYDAKQAGLTDRTIMELATIFGWDIDFAQNLRKGDSFSLLYESRYTGNTQLENGHILAAEFINRGSTYQAVRFVDKNGRAEYFSPDGKSMRKTFLRNPIDFARVSSHFNLRRKHPVLNRIRAHKGVDYAAPTGTPIKTTGDGRIVYRGVKGGYGRVVIIQHGQKYSSLYAHLSKYGRYKKGAHVKQGQVIGYVGKSGLATGAHLHYEFRVNGVHKNPLTAKFPAATPINKNLMSEFKQQTTPLLSQLRTAKQTHLAQSR